MGTKRLQRFGLVNDLGILARMKQPLRCVPLYRGFSVQHSTKEPVFDLLVLKEQKRSDSSFLKNKIAAALVFAAGSSH